MSTDILHSFPCTPYRVILCHLTGDIKSALIMQQMEYWFGKQGKRFYKFLGIPKKPHPQYRTNDSWTEELGMSEKVFRRAFDKIGVRHGSKTAYKTTENPFINTEGKELFFCSYYDKPSHLTYYFRNNRLLNKTLCALVDQVKHAREVKQAARTALEQSGSDVELPELEDLTILSTTPTEPEPKTKSEVKPEANKAVIESAKASSEVEVLNHSVLSRNDAHFKGLNGDEITSIQKILKVIEPDKQQEVLQVLQKNSQQGKVKNKIGYLQALVKAVLAKGFSPLKPKIVSPVVTEIDNSANEKAYSVEEYVQTMRAKHQKQSSEHSTVDKQFFKDWKQGLHFGLR